MSDSGKNKPRSKFSDHDCRSRDLCMRLRDSDLSSLAGFGLYEGRIHFKTEFTSVSIKIRFPC